MEILQEMKKVFAEKFSSQQRMRTAMVPYKQEDKLLNVPLWAIEYIKK